MLGPSKVRELHRSAELYVEIARTQGPYFALAFLYDSGYGREEIQRVLEIIKAQRLEDKWI